MPDETIDAEAYRELGRRAGALTLVVYRETGAEVTQITDGSYVAGRDAGLWLTVDDRRISRRHAVIDVRGDLVTVTDLGSRNGTVVAGRALEPNRPQPLRAGDTVLLGGAVVIVLTEAEAAHDAPFGVTSDADMLDTSMAELVATLRRVATTPLSVLILGETGVGKEVVARTVHAWSARKDRPFVAVNCAALPETLLESELFGHEKGAFTGATDAKAGLVETADGGTLFLDEVGEIAPRLQAKLLRFLDEQSFQRVGGTERKRVDVRVLAATNRDLRAAVDKGAFREDLLFRLNAVMLHVPALQDRPNEIEPFCRHFAGEMAKRLRRRRVEFAPEALEMLRRYGWPGNVRELRNVIERAVVLCDGTVGLAHLPERLRAQVPAAPAGVRDELRQLERQRIHAALVACGWNQTRAAEKLGMPRRTLVHKLRQYGLRKNAG